MRVEEEKATALIDGFYEVVRAQLLDPCSALTDGLHKTAIHTAGYILFNALVYGNEKAPIGADCVIQYTDTPKETTQAYISFGDFDAEDEEASHDSHGVHDERIFYYTGGEKDLKDLMTKGVEDFIVLDYDLIFADAKIINA